MHPRTEDFCDMLCDLAACIKPRLTLVDAVLCMEGNGPTQGKPRHMGALLAADTPFNADLVCAGLIGFEPAALPTVAAAIRRGLCPASASELKISGGPAAFALPDFEKLPAPADITFKKTFPFVNAFLRRNFGTGPKVDAGKCVGCGKCAEVCPAGAAALRKGKAHINSRICIHCFCCQEFCPKGRSAYNGRCWRGCSRAESPGVDVDELGAELGVHDLLAAVEPGVAREHV